MKKCLIIFCGLSIFSACVSNSTYYSALDEANEWEQKYHDLKNDYDYLTRQYNNVVYQYNSTKQQSENYYDMYREYVKRVNNAKSKLGDVRSEFYDYAYGNTSYNSVMNYIGDVEEALDGW